MSTTEQHLKQIQDKLQQLLKQYAAVQKENSKLKEELELIKQKISAQQKNVDDLKQQVGVL
jgi:peptidoglycan hydrolase CwlO-like protein